MRKSLLATAAAFILVAGPQASAEETLLDHLVAACETDLVSYCSDVKMGEGRILACLSEHEAEISASCKAAIVDTVAE